MVIGHRCKRSTGNRVIPPTAWSSYSTTCAGVRHTVHSIDRNHCLPTPNREKEWCIDHPRLVVADQRLTLPFSRDPQAPQDTYRSLCAYLRISLQNHLPFVPGQKTRESGGKQTQLTLIYPTSPSEKPVRSFLLVFPSPFTYLFLPSSFSLHRIASLRPLWRRRPLQPRTVVSACARPRGRFRVLAPMTCWPADPSSYPPIDTPPLSRIPRLHFTTIESTKDRGTSSTSYPSIHSHPQHERASTDEAEINRSPATLPYSPFSSHECTPATRDGTQF